MYKGEGAIPANIPDIELCICTYIEMRKTVDSNKNEWVIIEQRKGQTVQYLYMLIFTCPCKDHNN
jgi:hypothetical protein